MADAAPADALLRSFLALSNRNQVEFLARLTAGVGGALRNRYLAWASRPGAGDPPTFTLAPLARMLERLDPAAYLDAEQDADLRASLTPSALKAVRGERMRSPGTR